MKEAENSIQDRLKQVFDALGITIYQIAKDLDENSSKFYNILSGRAKPSYDTIFPTRTLLLRKMITWMYRLCRSSFTPVLWKAMEKASGSRIWIRVG